MNIDEQTLATFAQVIGALMNPDNNIRNQAEAHFNECKKDPDKFVGCLVTLLRHSQDEQVRSMCAVLLRKAMGASAGKDSQSLITMLTPQCQAYLKSELLLAVEHEPQRNIRKKASDTVGQLGICTLSEGQWPELLPFMLQCTKSGNPQIHEAGLHIFGVLSDILGEKMKPHHGTLKEVFSASLADGQSNGVRVAALRALTSFLLALENATERHPFQDLVPSMLQTISSALNTNAEDEARDALEVFVEIAETQSKFLKRFIAEVVQAMLQIAASESLEESTRHLALEFLLTLSENSPTLVRKLPNFCEHVLPIALGMMLDVEGDTAEEIQEWEAQEEDEDDTEITNYDVGEEALDRFAIALGGKTLLPILFAKIEELITSTEWKQRHAALMAISQTGEGCAKQMGAQLKTIVQKIVTHFADPHPRVRWAAINTIGQMSTDFGPELQSKLHQLVLPALVQVMDDSSVRVQSHAAAAVINFCEHCNQETLRPYLEGLLGKLLLLLQRNIRRVQEQAVTAVASVADVAEGDFVHFYDAFMPGLTAILESAQGKDYRMLRGKAMECISLIGVAVGKEKFGPDAKKVMDILIATQGSALEPDDPQVSFVLQACARICKCLGEHFLPYLPMVVPPLLKSASIDPELHVTDADEDGGEADQEEGLESVTVSIRGVGNKRISIRTSALEEKATACNMLHSYAMELRAGFFPFVQEVARILVPLIKFHYMEDVRTAAVMTMPELLNAVVGAVEKGTAGATVELAVQMRDFMFEPMVEQLKCEPDVETLTTMVEAFSEVIQVGLVCPQCVLNPQQLQEVSNVFHMLLAEFFDRRQDRMERKQEEEMDEEEAEAMEEEAEAEESLMSQIVECLGSVLKAHKSSFLPHFNEQLAVYFQQMVSNQAQSSDRTAAICVFDDIIEHCSVPDASGISSANYVPWCTEVLLQSATETSPDVRQAAVYGLGVLAEFGGEAFPPDKCQSALNTLMQVVMAPDAKSEENETATDNAISAVGKMCLFRAQCVNTAQVLPQWLAQMPVKGDRVEARVVHAQLCTQVEASNPHLLGAQHEHLPAILHVMAKILGTDLVDKPLTVRIVNIIKQVQQGLPEVLQQVWATLDETQQKAIQTALAAQ